jgi:hypothetical protein
MITLSPTQIENTKAPVKYKNTAEFHIIFQFLPVTSKTHPVNATPIMAGIMPIVLPRAKTMPLYRGAISSFYAEIVILVIFYLNYNQYASHLRNS